jgi:hypothetical protein
MTKKSMGLFLAALSLCLGGVVSTAAQAAPPTNQATLGCVSTFFTRLSGTELHRGVLALSNNGGVGQITIDRVYVYDGTGALRFDYPSADVMPATFKNVLQEHQTTTVRTSDFFTSGLSANERPIQVFIDISAAQNFGKDDDDAFGIGHTRQIRDKLTGETRAQYYLGLCGKQT